MALKDVFKFKDSDGHPAFYNTLAVVATYIFIGIFHYKQISLICPTFLTLELQVDKLVDAVGVSTFTYILTAILPTFVTSHGKSSFSLNHWILLGDIVYVLLLGFFIPRSLHLNIFLCLFTVALVYGTSYSIGVTFKTAESGQADGSKMKGADKGEDTHIC